MTDENSQHELTRRRTISGLAALGAATTLSGVGAAVPGRGRGSSGAGGAASGRGRQDTTQFTVRIENTSPFDVYPTAPDPPVSTGGAVWITFGAYAVYHGPNPISRRRRPASPGLEAIAEAGVPRGTPENDTLLDDLAQNPKVSDSGSFTFPETVADPNDPSGRVPGTPPLAPGGAFEFEIEASRGRKLAFASSFAPSNDAFLAPGNGGIPLFASGSPVEGSVTDQIRLWDAGTEPNEPPSSGSPNQYPRQYAQFRDNDKGPDENGVVRELRPTDNVGDGYHYPDPDEVVEVTITPQ